jgi:hypothetical protein
MSGGVWVAIGCALAVVIVTAIVASWRERSRDLGSVSDQWIAHHRGNSPDGSDR